MHPPQSVLYKRAPVVLYTPARGSSATIPFTLYPLFSIFSITKLTLKSRSSYTCIIHVHVPHGHGAKRFTSHNIHTRFRMPEPSLLFIFGPKRNKKNAPIILCVFRYKSVGHGLPGNCKRSTIRFDFTAIGLEIKIFPRDGYLAKPDFAVVTLEFQTAKNVKLRCIFK